jgi:hypothetical protein
MVGNRPTHTASRPIPLARARNPPPFPLQGLPNATPLQKPLQGPSGARGAYRHGLIPSALFWSLVGASPLQLFRSHNPAPRLTPNMPTSRCSRFGVARSGGFHSAARRAAPPCGGPPAPGACGRPACGADRARCGSGASRGQATTDRGVDFRSDDTSPVGAQTGLRRAPAGST